MSKQMIWLEKKGTIWKVKTEDILCIKQECGEMIIVTKENEFREDGSIDEIIDKCGDEFYRSHKYCVINFDNVYSMKDTQIVFNNGKYLSMGVNLLRSTRKAFVEYLNH